MLSLAYSGFAFVLIANSFLCGNAATLRVQATSTDLASGTLKLLGTKLRGHILSGWAQEFHEADADDSDDDNAAGDDALDEDASNARIAFQLTHAHSKMIPAEIPVVIPHSRSMKPASFHKEEQESADKETPQGLVTVTTPPTEAPSSVDAEEDEDRQADTGTGNAGQESEDEDEREEDGEGDERDEAEGALEAAKDKKLAAQSKLEAFHNDTAFGAKVARDVAVIANETKSPMLSNFLGELRLEMREYSKPSYSKYLEDRAKKAEKRVQTLEAELEAEDHKKQQIQGDQSKNETTNTSHNREKEALMNQSEEGVDGTRTEDSSNTFALSFFANVAFLACIFAMASTKETLVRGYTWHVIDQIVVIFLAVLYFNAFDSLLDFHEAGVGNVLICSLLHAVVVLCITLYVAAKLRRYELSLAVLCACAAHVVSFSSVHAVAAVQVHIVSSSYNLVMCIFGMIVVALGLLGILYITWRAKKSAELLADDDFMDKTDGLENDCCAMAFSVVFTMFIRFVLTGHHPTSAETEFDHSANQRMLMLIYAFAALAFAGFCVQWCARKSSESDSYAAKRVYEFVSTVASMNVAWAFLYWGEWQFYEELFKHDAVRGRLAFAIVATVVAGIALLCLAKLPTSSGLSFQKQRLAALTALSLLCAWSWEHCMDAAIEDMVKGKSHPVTLKVLTTLAMFSIVLPVYIWFLRPTSSAAVQAMQEAQ